jgi:hypothetical protein
MKSSTSAEARDSEAREQANEFDMPLEFLKQLPIIACRVRREVSRSIQGYEIDLSPKEG